VTPPAGTAREAAQSRDAARSAREAARPVRRPAGPPAQLAGLLAVVVLAVLLGSAVPAYRAQAWSIWAVYGILAVSFTFVWGHCGIFSFSQAAFFGIGGYAYGVIGLNLFATTGESVTALLGAAAVAAAVAAVAGYFIFYGNVRDVYVAVITLAMTLVLLTFTSSTAGPNYHIGQALLGGYNGMIGVLPLTLPGVGDGDSVFLGPNQFFTAAMVLAGTCGFGLHWLLRRPFGRITAGIRENESRTQLLGYDVRRYKLIAFSLGGAVAGLGGGLYAAWGTFINPSVFTLQQAALVPIWVLVGGRRSLFGAFVGVILVEGLSTALGSTGATITPIVLGGTLIAVVLFLPQGIVPTLAGLARGRLRWLGSQRPPPAPPPPPPPLPPGPADVDRQTPHRTSAAGRPEKLVATGLAKHFGGVAAVTGVDLTFLPGTVACLIGPNGAGKSTLFNLLAGRYRPSAGSVRLGQRDITRARPDQRARLGIGIKLQVPSIYAELTVLENVWLAAYAAHRGVAAADRATLAALHRLDLFDLAHQAAGTLSHGRHQWLEICMVLARDPAVLLLDEPTAGMTQAEKDRTIELIRGLAGSATVIVVEHDMEFVRRLGAPVTVFHDGAVFAQGDIEQIRRDDRVLDIYLGRRGSDAAR
jgi:branched-chain amino acid transport system permease protein